MKKIISLVFTFSAVCLFAGNLMADCSSNRCTHVQVEDINYGYGSESVYIATSGNERSLSKSSCAVNIFEEYYLLLHESHPNLKNAYAGILAAKMAGKPVSLWINESTCRIDRIILD